MPIEKRVDAHDERLNEHSKRFTAHDARITQLEKFDEDKHLRLKEVEQNYGELKNTIVEENREMRLFFQSNMSQQWDLIKSRDKQRHDSRRMRHELDKTKLERFSDIFFKLVGSGGLLYLIVHTLLS